MPATKTRRPSARFVALELIGTLSILAGARGLAGSRLGPLNRLTA